MNTLAVINFAFLCGFGMLHIAMAYLCFRYLTRTTPIKLPDDYSPKAVVVMSLRGNDPFLRRTLMTLREQTYQNYSIRIVVDSKSDPAWQVVEDVATQSHHIDLEYEVLRERSENRGLKCSALIQAVESMNEDEEILVLSDADVVPNENWLRDLVAPLSDAEIGIATGNQWFDPTIGETGSLVRNVWHAGAIIPTVVYGNPWAGSCAMRLSDVRDSGLLDKWRTTIVDDGPISRTLREFGKRIHVVPTQVIVNREECDLSFCASYIRRMLTWSRLYERTFIFTPLHMLGFVGSLLTVFSLLLYGAYSGNGFVTWLAIAGIACTIVSNLTAYLLVDSAVVCVVQRRRESLKPATLQRLLKLGCHFPIAIGIYAWAVCPAIFSRRIKWRGISYKMHGPRDIKLIDDSPFEAGDSDDEETASV